MTERDIRIEWSQDHAFQSNLVAVRATEQLPVHKIGGMVVVSSEFVADAALHPQDFVLRRLDRVFNPWRYPDRNPFPVIDLFPRLTAWQVRAQRLRARVADAFAVLTGRADIDDWEDDE